LFAVENVLDSRSWFRQRRPEWQPKMTSIFFLTSIFNHSIHSSIAVFHSDRRSMKMERENRNMATKKKAKKKSKKK
jgi:hypothetical protein